MTGEPFPDRFRRWYGMLPPALRILMTVNTVIYLAWVLINLLGISPVARFTLATFALYPEIPGVLFRPWQVLTYSFLHIHPGLWGFIAFGFNMLWLYWLGREYEEFYGSHRLFALYVLSAVVGAIVAVLGSLVFGAPGVPVAGAMVAVLGVICGIATINPDRGIGLFLLGVIKLKWIAVAFVVISVLFAFGAWPYVLAYLGGAATGYGFGRAQLAGLDLGGWATVFFPRRSSYGGYAAGGGGGTRGHLHKLFSRRAQDPPPESPSRRGGSRRTSARAPEDDAVPQSGSSTIDRLLDKINDKGYDSLTEEEKRILYEASRND